jgi:hypothetical protein
MIYDAPMTSVYRALDVLGSTPWVINNHMLDVIQTAWDQGGGILDLPSRKDLVIPSPPPNYAQEDPKEQRTFKVMVLIATPPTVCAATTHPLCCSAFCGAMSLYAQVFGAAAAAACDYAATRPARSALLARLPVGCGA